MARPGRPKGYPKTGGRKPGTPNKATAVARAEFAAIFPRLTPNLEGWILETGRINPAKAAELTLKMAEYHVPRLSQVDVSGVSAAPFIVQVNSLARATPETPAIPAIPASPALPASQATLALPTAQELPASLALLTAPASPESRATPAMPGESGHSEMPGDSGHGEGGK